jgi:hypothetical protein
MINLSNSGENCRHFFSVLKERERELLNEKRRKKLGIHIYIRVLEKDKNKTQPTAFIRAVKAFV